MYHLRARYYNPNLGRFVSFDPAEDMINKLHKYNYCANNPINYTDPSGRIALIGLIICIGILLIACTWVLSKYLWGIKSDYGKFIGPEIGFNRWLKFNLRKATIESWNILPAVGVGGAGGMAHMLNNGRDWGIKNFSQRTIPKVKPNEVQTVRLFGHIVPSDVVGNISYGFVGGIAQIKLDDLLFVSNSGDIIQKKSLLGDDPEDQAAIRFGYELAKRYVGSGSDGLGSFDWEGFWVKGNIKETLEASSYLSEMTKPTAPFVERGDF